MNHRCDDSRVCAITFTVSLGLFGAVLFAMVSSKDYNSEASTAPMVAAEHLEEQVAAGDPAEASTPAYLEEQRMVQESIIEKQGEIQHDIDAIRAFLEDDIAAQSGEIPREEVLTIDEYVSQGAPTSNAQRRRSVSSPEEGESRSLPRPE